MNYFVRAVVERDGKYLVMRENRFDKLWWNFPGGKIGSDEGSTRACQWELREETGMILLAAKIPFIAVFDIDGIKWKVNPRYRSRTNAWK